jgi:hypothetical protein
MSIAAVVRYRTKEKDRRRPDYLPVATEQEFYEHWLPLADRHELELCQGFGAGVTIASSEIPNTVAELDVMAAAAAGLAYDAVRDRLLDRVSMLREFLLELDAEAVDDVFIG